MNKKVIIFDLDGTVAASKSPVEPRVVELLGQLLEKFQVCIISGGRFSQFEKQLLSRMTVDSSRLESLHIMPTCGTRYYRFKDGGWQLVYAEDLTGPEKQKIIAALNKGLDDLGMRAPKVYGQIIEDRESQITLSALGQDIIDELGEEGLRQKEAWDPDHVKKNKLRDHVAPLIPEFEVRVGGITSVDITKPGIDKAYGMKKLMEQLGVTKKDMLFVGDRLEEGGNDYPVKAMGIDCLEVSHWQDTAKLIETLL